MELNNISTDIYSLCLNLIANELMVPFRFTLEPTFTQQVFIYLLLLCKSVLIHGTSHTLTTVLVNVYFKTDLHLPYITFNVSSIKEVLIF